MGKKRPKPGMFSMFGFTMQKVSFASAGKGNVDYLYWKEKGWLEPSIGSIKRTAAWLTSKIALAGMYRPEDDEREAAGL